MWQLTRKGQNMCNRNIHILLSTSLNQFKTPQNFLVGPYGGSWPPQKLRCQYTVKSTNQTVPQLLKPSSSTRIIRYSYPLQTVIGQICEGGEEPGLDDLLNSLCAWKSLSILDIKIRYMVVCCSKLCIDIITLYTGRGIPPLLLHMVFLPFLPV